MTKKKKSFAEMKKEAVSKKQEKDLEVTTDTLYPKISIVTPSYNQGQFLEECIESILGQNYPNLEYIIMDGGSTDNSAEIIKKYEKYLTYWQSKPDNGQYQAINDGFKRTSGEIMAWLNSDDKYQPNAFFKVAATFKDFSYVEWMVGRPSYWNRNGNIFNVEPYHPTYSIKNYLKKNYTSPLIQQESTFWRRSLWEKAGGTLKTDLVFAGDFELWIRFFRYAPLCSVDTLIGGYRHHGEDQKGKKFFDKYCLEAEKIRDKEISLYNISLDEISLPVMPVMTFPRETFLSNANLLDGESIRKINCWRNYLSDLEAGMKNCKIKGLPELFSFVQAELTMINNIKSKTVYDE
jgi:glycosyltransferase involved in cell wall biosynthesis